MNKEKDELMDKANKFFKTDVRYLVRSGFWLTFSQIFSSFAALAISIIFANYVSKDTYGLYKYVLSIVGILSISSLYGIDTALSQAIARNFDGSFVPALKRKILWGFIGSAVGFGISFYYYIQMNNLLAFSVLAASILMPFMNGFDTYNSVLAGKRQFKRFSFYNAWSQIITTILIIAAILLSKNAIVIISVYFLANTLVNLYFLRKTLKNNTLNNLVDPETMSYGNHLSVMDIINTIANQLDKILVFHYFGAIELAVYSMAVAPTEQIKGLLKNINFMAMPKFATRTKEEIKIDMRPKLIQLGIFSLVIVIAYIIFAPTAFHYLFPKYLDSVAYSQVVAISIVASILGTFMYTALKAQASTKELYEYNIYTNLFSIIVLSIGIAYWGLWGAIIARVIGRFFLFGFSYYLIKKM